MKYWNDVVTATKYKLGIGLKDSDDDEYEAQMPYYANECLTMIANDMKAHIKEIVIVNTMKNLKIDMPEDFLSFSGISMFYLNYPVATSETLSELTDVPEGTTYICIDSIVSGFKAGKGYKRVGDNWVEVDVEKTARHEYHPKVEYENWNSLILPEIGTYKIRYNALYGEIPFNMFKFNETAYVDFDLTKDYTEAEYNEEFGITGGDESKVVFNGIYPSVLNLLPTYIAAKLLEQDDIRMSTILMNQFEIMAQRLETDERYEVEHYVSEGGWY